MIRKRRLDDLRWCLGGAGRFLSRLNRGFPFYSARCSGCVEKVIAKQCSP